MQFGTDYFPMVNPPLLSVDGGLNAGVVNTRPMLMPEPLPQEAIMRRAGQSMQGRPNPVYNNPAPTPDPVLRSVNQFEMNRAPVPALSSSNTKSSRDVSSTTPNQGRRSNTMLSVQRPDLGIGTNEMLMRVGGAGLANAGQGGLAAYGAMFDQYGNIQDQRRTNALAEYNADYGAQQDELARQDALKIAELEAQSKNAPDADAQQQIGQMDQALMDMQRAKAYLQEGNITGFIDNNVRGLFDKFTGNKRAVGRKLLEKLRVDDTLLRIAQTKGAISNKEMDLFLAPSPDLNDQETVWMQWIDDRMNAIQAVRQRLSSGQSVDQSQQATQGQVNQFGGSGGGISLPAVGQSTNVGGVTVKRIS